MYFEAEEGATSQGTQVATGSQEGKDSSLRASKRNQPCAHLDSNPVKLILDF